MQKIKQISNIFIKHMALIVLAVACVSLFAPKSALWIKTSWINNLLMVVMFGMGLTLKPNDFLLILKRPKEIILGSIAQFTIMPSIALILSRAFGLDAALTAGVVLVGTCPGGTSSNVITYFSKGDVALSVCMTSVNTLLSVILTPVITYLLLKTTVEVDATGMLFSILKIILIPIILGFCVNKYFAGYTKKSADLLPVISVVAICTIVAAVVSHNAEKIYTSGFLIFIVVVLHNIFGYGLGFIFGKIFKMSPEKIKAFSIEIGMQNSGLAVSLANTAFHAFPAASIPGAFFSVWHNISGAVLAGIYQKWTNKDN